MGQSAQPADIDKLAEEARKARRERYTAAHSILLRAEYRMKDAKGDIFNILLAPSGVSVFMEDGQHIAVKLSAEDRSAVLNHWAHWGY